MSSTVTRCQDGPDLVTGDARFIGSDDSLRIAQQERGDLKVVRPAERTSPPAKRSLCALGDVSEAC